MKKVLLTLCFLGLVFSQVDAQIVSKYWRMVYLWDVTYSMHGGYFAPTAVKGTVTVGGQKCEIVGYNKNNDIYDEILAALLKDIDTMNENTEIVVIPFGQKVLGCWKEKGTAEGKANLRNKIESFCDLKPADVQKTSISGALEYACNNVFTADMPNTLKLMTDGRENDNTVKFYYLLRHWCQFAEERNVQGYYFILSEEALKGDPNLKDELKKSCFTVIDDFSSLVVKDTYVTLTPAEQTVLMKEEFGKPIKMQVNMQNATDDVKAALRFQLAENDFFRLDTTIEVTAATKEIELNLQNVLSEKDIRDQMPSTEHTEMVMSIKLANEAKNVVLQTSESKLIFINEALKKVVIYVE